MFSPTERRYVETARVGRLATADAAGRPHVVPVCFALVDDTGDSNGSNSSNAPEAREGSPRPDGSDAWIATPIDEKPKDAAPSELRRVRDVRENPRVALVVDHWTESWDGLGWVQVRGTAEVLSPGNAADAAAHADHVHAEADAHADHVDADAHADAVDALRRKYDQYADHAIEERPVVRIHPGHVVSWGSLERPE